MNKYTSAALAQGHSKTSTASSSMGSAASTVSPFPKNRSPKQRLWTVSKTPSPLPLGMYGRHILTGEELSPIELNSVLEFAEHLKKQRKEHRSLLWLQGRQLALVFEKQSLRTRVSFTVGMQDLGGFAIDIPSSQRKTEEPEDTARVLAGYCHGIMVRTFSQKTLERMALVSPVPVINGLSDDHHPCQALADILTLKERFGTLEGLKLAYIGDGNNVLNSLLLLAPVLGVEVRYACPKGYKPDPTIVFRAEQRALGRGSVVECESPEEAATGAHALYTDVWTSMGFEAENEARLKAFDGYKVDEKLHALADPEAVVMHCLPMIRDQEISGALADSPHSVIFQQSENRLHAQKALLVGLMSDWVRNPQ
jgi:ornithine carbamoyltransferase